MGGGVGTPAAPPGGGVGDAGVGSDTTPNGERLLYAPLVVVECKYINGDDGSDMCAYGTKRRVVAARRGLHERTADAHWVTARSGRIGVLYVPLDCEASAEESRRPLSEAEEEEEEEGESGRYRKRRGGRDDAPPSAPGITRGFPSSDEPSDSARCAMYDSVRVRVATR